MNVPHRPPERLIVYVDGFNLYHGLHDATGRANLWLDLVALAKSLRPRSNLVGVKYFTAPVLNEPAAVSRQAHHQGALLAKYPSLLSIVQGRYQSKQVTCVRCGHSYIKHEEKETDVNIAVQLVADAARHEMDAALVISADSDLAPAVRMAKRIEPRLFVAAAFPPKRFSNELKALMPVSFQIGANRFRKVQLPDTFTIGGVTYNRPAKWA